MKVIANRSQYQTSIQKYWISIILLLLIFISFVSSQISLLTALIFTFLIPGLIATRFIKLETYFLYAFVPIFSVLVSTQLVYYLSLLAGYSKTTILLSFLILASLYTFVTYIKGSNLSTKQFLKSIASQKKLLFLFTVIFGLSAIVLFRSVWFENQQGIIITGSNWQDTPLHYEIINGLNNGNFPPQMPYFSGDSLNYHYFVDFHTAILEKVYGLLPTLLPFSNAIFILLFGFSIYALARVNGKKSAVISTIIGIFGAGFGFYMLFSSIANGGFVASHNYMYEYSGLFGLPPIFDNLLQQRPLLVGLPVFAMVLFLLRNMHDKRRVVLAGVLTGLVFQFHVISFVCCFAVFFVGLLLNSRRFRLSFLYFLVPLVLALPFVMTGGTPTSFSFGAFWPATFVVGNPLVYFALNLGIPFFIAIFSFIKRRNVFLKTTLVVIFLIPIIFWLTPNVWDMYKFFIFAWIPIAVLCGTILAKLHNFIVILLVVFSILTSVNVIVYNMGTKFQAVSWNEYDAGIWIKENTPEQSVFLTYYSIHSPPTMIGGRLRVLSYTNWPYGHGISLDAIWQREDDIDQAFQGNETELKEVLQGYSVEYIYAGGEEQRYYPGCVSRFNSIEWLENVYSKNDLYVFKVNLSENP